ncbi:pentatricopeptide repeat-containing protein At1g26900, mitochondrial-like [Aristolochia californica]|uniref:pentatricopeptide repeat-containing protein At1g26900, mitochondrial-like n=1 Tax=Aristolochia californica TaxID=171875 RepID=UPI0035E13B9C
MSWTAMLNGNGLHGQGEKALQMLQKMEQVEAKPNEVTFPTALSACSHGGLVIEGKKCFQRMIVDYGFLPRIEHFGCMIDLLGRAACRVRGNVELVELTKMALMVLGAKQAENFYLIESIYSLDRRKFRKKDLMEEKPMRKDGGHLHGLRRQNGKTVKRSSSSKLGAYCAKSLGDYGFD